MVAAASLTAVVLPGVALLGYVTGLRILAQLVPAGPAMVPGTAVALVLAGAGLWLVAVSSPPPGRRRASQALSLIVALYGVGVLVEYLTGHNSGAGTLLFPDRVRAWSAGLIPGRPAPYTAVALLVTGLAVALLDVDVRGGYRPGRVLAPAGGLVAGVALVGHAYGLTYLSGPSAVVTMAYNTAAALVALSVGLICCRPDRPAAIVFLGKGQGGVAVRRLAPIVFVTVLLVGALLTAVGSRDLPAEGTLVAAAGAALVLLLYITFLRAGTALNHADSALRAERDFSQTVLNSLREGVLTTTADGVVVDVTPRWCVITGYPAQDVVGRAPPYPWWPPERLAEMTENRTVALVADTVTDFDMVIRRKDGTDVEVLVTTSLVNSRTGTRLLVCTYRDLTERNRIEAERRHAAERLNHFFDISTDLLCVAGSDGYFKNVNPSWTRTLGFTAEELTGRPYIEFIHPDDVERTNTEASELFELGKTTASFENRFRCRDGTYRRLNWNAIPVPDEGLVYAVARDTTDRWHAEEVRARLAAIVEGTQDAIIGKALDGAITSWNPAAERQYGYTAIEAVGHNIRMILPPEHPDEIADILDRISRGQPIQLHNAVRVRKDGSRLHVAVSISPIQDSYGFIIGAASIARDVTERMKAEERFQRLVLAAPDAMLIAEADGTIVLVNEQTERLFGYRAADLIGEPVELLIPAQLRSQHAAHRHDYHAAPQIRRMGVGLELVGQRRDGSQFPVEISLAPLDSDQGTLVSAAIRDITERRQVEQTLAHARDEALAAAQLKSQFVAMVSHEIRTPMNGVIGLTNLLLEAPLEPGPRRYAQAIRTSGQALLLIINDILDFSKIEAGKIELVDVDYDLDRLLDDVTRAVAEPARDKELEIVAYYPPDLPITLRGDAGRLRQALLNLLGNAVKFTEHGEVQLRAEPAPAASDGGPQVTFTVTDTGIGIDAKDLPRLFEPFSQVDGSTNREFGGTGLGLTITRQLVKLMHGRLDVQSRPGHGSRFSFTIPVAVRSDPAGRKLFADRLSGRKLLVVDGNPTKRQLISQHARAWGMIPSEAPDGHTAVDLLHHAAQHRRPYDVAVIDQNMPDLDGLQLARQVTADSGLPPLNLVLLTSGSHRDDQIAADVGAAVLPKPISPSQLYNCLLGILDPHTARTSQQASITDLHPNARGLILLAEDNTINQMVAVDTLAILGYQVDIARNGLEALELAGTKPYLAILMDCQMPKMDGYTATTELRHRENPNRHIPIIAMTAGALTEDKQRCIAAGMDDYLAKPIDPDQLQAALDRWTTETTTPTR